MRQRLACYKFQCATALLTQIRGKNDKLANRNLIFSHIMIVSPDKKKTQQKTKICDIIVWNYQYTISLGAGANNSLDPWVFNIKKPRKLLFGTVPLPQRNNGVFRGMRRPLVKGSRLLPSAQFFGHGRTSYSSHQSTFSLASRNQSTISLDSRNQSTISLDSRNQSTISVNSSHPSTISLDSNHQSTISLDSSHQSTISLDSNHQSTISLDSSHQTTRSLDSNPLTTKSLYSRH